MKRAWAQDFTLPAQYTDIDSEEMRYIDGGYFVDIPTWSLSALLDVILIGIGLGAMFAPIKVLGKTFGKTLAKKFLVSHAPRMAAQSVRLIANITGTAVNITTGALMNFLTDGFWAFTSLGGIISYAIDCADKTGRDGSICF